MLPHETLCPEHQLFSGLRDSTEPVAEEKSPYSLLYTYLPADLYDRYSTQSVDARTVRLRLVSKHGAVHVRSRLCYVERPERWYPRHELRFRMLRKKLLSISTTIHPRRHMGRRRENEAVEEKT